MQRILPQNPLRSFRPYNRPLVVHGVSEDGLLRVPHLINAGGISPMVLVQALLGFLLASVVWVLAALTQAHICFCLFYIVVWRLTGHCV
jgi:hypothetical protein